MNNNRIIIALFAVMICAIGYLYHSVGKLQENQKFNSTQTVQSIEKQISESRKIYIYNLEEVLRKINAVDEKVQMEEEILKLNNKLSVAEKKIKSLKNAKVKEDFSDMYVESVRMKRDEILENYQKTLNDITDRINTALSEIAKEKNVSAVFVHSAIAVRTPYVEDITDEVVARIQK